MGNKNGSLEQHENIFKQGNPVSPQRNEARKEKSPISIVKKLNKLSKHESNDSGPSDELALLRKAQNIWAQSGDPSNLEEMYKTEARLSNTLLNADPEEMTKAQLIETVRNLRKQLDKANMQINYLMKISQSGASSSSASSLANPKSKRESFQSHTNESISKLRPESKSIASLPSTCLSENDDIISPEKLSKPLPINRRLTLHDRTYSNSSIQSRKSVGQSDKERERVIHIGEQNLVWSNEVMSNWISNSQLRNGNASTLHTSSPKKFTTRKLSQPISHYLYGTSTTSTN